MSLHSRTVLLASYCRPRPVMILRLSPLSPTHLKELNMTETRLFVINPSPSWDQRNNALVQYQYLPPSVVSLGRKY